MNLAIISERIRQKRRSKRLTQMDLAELLGVSDMTVRRWEAGKSSPRIEEIRKISEALDTSVDYLMGNDEMKAGTEEITIDSNTMGRDISVNSRIGRLFFKDGDREIDLPATPEGFKAFNNVLLAMMKMNNPIAVGAN